MTQRSRRRRMALTVAGWLGAAALATAVTLAAVSSIGAGIFGDSAGPLPQDEVEQALASLPPEQARSPGPEPEPGSGPTTDAPTAPATSDASPSPAATPEMITSPGGNVLARCVDGRVELLSWSPAQGYSVDSVDSEQTRTAEIEFEAEDRDVEIEVRCADGVPEATIEADD